MPTELAGVYQLRQAKIWQRKNRAAETRPLIPHASPGFQLVEEPEPRSGEAVIDKITMSAFEGTRSTSCCATVACAYLIAGVAMEVGLEPTVPALRRPGLHSYCRARRVRRGESVCWGMAIAASPSPATRSLSTPRTSARSSIRIVNRLPRSSSGCHRQALPRLRCQAPRYLSQSAVFAPERDWCATRR